jgi:hypothetical protein
MSELVDESDARLPIARCVDEDEKENWRLNGFAMIVGIDDDEEEELSWCRCD